MDPRPERLVLRVTDEAAVKHLRGRSWQGAAIRDMGVEIVVVPLEVDDVQAMRDGQKRQCR